MEGDCRVKEIDYSSVIPKEVEWDEEEEAAALESITATRQVDRLVQRMLLATLLLSALLFLAGAIWQVAAGAPPVHQVVRLSDLPRANGPTLLFSLGLIVLIVSPVLRLIGVAIGLARQGDWKFVGVTIIVLGIVFSGLWIG